MKIMCPSADPCQATVGEWIVRRNVDKLRRMPKNAISHKRDVSVGFVDHRLRITETHYRDLFVGGLIQAGIPE